MNGIRTPRLCLSIPILFKKCAIAQAVCCIDASAFSGDSWKSSRTGSKRQTTVLVRHEVGRCNGAESRPYTDRAPAVLFALGAVPQTQFLSV